MKKETRTVVYDDGLRLEAYRFEGIVQPFPSHFHEHYVIGFVEKGERVLSCRDREYTIGEGSLLLFNPDDSHACVQSDGGTFDYRGFNIPKETMLDLAEEVSGKRQLPGFSENVVYDDEAKRLLAEAMPPVEVVLRTGFSDQSHFTNYFNQFIGLAPGTYREIFSEKNEDGVEHGK